MPPTTEARANDLGRLLENDATMAKLDWNYTTLSMDQWKELADALRTNRTLKELSLAYCGLGPKGGELIAGAVEEHPSLTTLDLQYNNIGDETAKAFAEMLGVNTTLTTLNLSGTNIGDEGAKAFAEMLRVNTTLTTLNLRWNEIGEEGAKAFAEMLGVNTTLTTLNLSGTNIGDEGAKAFAEMLRVNTTLTTLNLRWNEIGEEGAKAFAEMLGVNTTLTTLNLSANKIGDEGAKAFAEMLRVNTTLTTLNLRSNKIGDEGAKAFAEMLRVNTTLTTLNLRWNEIGEEGAKAFAEMLRVNTTLTTLNLSGIYIDEDLLDSIAALLKKNKEADEAARQRLEEANVKAIAEIHALPHHSALRSLFHPHSSTQPDVESSTIFPIPALSHLEDTLRIHQPIDGGVLGRMAVDIHNHCAGLLDSEDKSGRERLGIIDKHKTLADVICKLARFEPLKGNAVDLFSWIDKLNAAHRVYGEFRDVFEQVKAGLPDIDETLIAKRDALRRQLVEACVVLGRESSPDSLKLVALDEEVSELRGQLGGALEGLDLDRDAEMEMDMANLLESIAHWRVASDAERSSIEEFGGAVAAVRSMAGGLSSIVGVIDGSAGVDEAARVLNELGGSSIGAGAGASITDIPQVDIRQRLRDRISDTIEGLLEIGGMEEEQKQTGADTSVEISMIKAGMKLAAKLDVLGAATLKLKSDVEFYADFCKKGTPISDGLGSVPLFKDLDSLLDDIEERREAVTVADAAFINVRKRRKKTPADVDSAEEEARSARRAYSTARHEFESKIGDAVAITRDFFPEARVVHSDVFALIAGSDAESNLDLHVDGNVLEAYESAVPWDAGGRHQMYAVRRDGRDYAVKEFKLTEGSNVASFNHEIRTLNRVKCDGVVPVTDCRIDSDSMKGYIEMPRYAQSLEDMLNGNGNGDSKMSEERIGAFLGRLLRTTDLLYHRKIAHRDIKPSNILIHDGSDGAPVLCDFDVARETGTLATTLATAAGGGGAASGGGGRVPGLVGTLLFMAPEVLDPSHDDALDLHKADIWSLGLVAICMLDREIWNRVQKEGRRAWFGLDGAVVVPNTANAALGTLVKRMVSLNPADRPTAGDALADAYFAADFERHQKAIRESEQAIAEQRDTLTKTRTDLVRQESSLKAERERVTRLIAEAEAREERRAELEALERALSHRETALQAQMRQLECVACMNAPALVALEPCGHQCACPECADQLNQCPMCRARVTGRLRVYGGGS